MKKIVFLMVLLLTFGANAQFSVNAGGSMLQGFGAPRPWGGLHVGVEIPRDDAVSIFGRVTHHFKQSAMDSILTFATANNNTTTPFTTNVMALPSMNYTILEGGTRYYLGDGFDYGWGGYGGTELMLVFNRIKTDYSPFDEVQYSIDPTADFNGVIFSLGGGLTGGVKYSMAGVGTFYFDANLAYMFLSQRSQANVYTGLFSSLFFGFNLGFRKDFY